MDFILVVVRAFGPHAVGDHITNSDAITAALGSDHAGSVVAVQVPSKPEDH